MATKSRFKRTPEQLEQEAVLDWPAELASREASTSVIPILIQTQDVFISLLHMSSSGPEAWKGALNLTNGLSPNVFLKHLMVLSDFGGEPLRRITHRLSRIFPKGCMTYSWESKQYTYRFKELTKAPKRVGNADLYVDGRGLLARHDLDGRMQDVSMLLLHGGAAVNGVVPDPVREKCILGTMIGQKQELDEFVRQRYIWVSRITGGATSNRMGQLAQDYVKELLGNALPNWQFTRNGTIPGISQNRGRTNTTFDLVAKSPSGRIVAIEISFQFTTNSVIERKSGQAAERARAPKAAGHHIAYVLDGAGNFERKSALTTICRNSDCNVTMAKKEIGLLIQFLKSVG